MKKKIIILIILFLSVRFGAAHPIHITIVNIDYISDSGYINYSVRLFYDDFEVLINHKYNTFINFGRQNQMTFKEKESIADYLNSVLVLKGNNLQIIKPEMTGWKVEDVSVWFYFQSPVLVNIDSLWVENKLMLEIFNDQKNMFILNAGNDIMSFEFNHRITDKLFTFN